MNKKSIITAILFFVVLSISVFVLIKNKKSGLSITYPFNEALFPPEFPAPTFEWTSENSDAGSWEMELITENKKYAIRTTTEHTSWTPEESAWDSIKQLSDYDNIYFSVKKAGDFGYGEEIFFKISQDTVGAPILYRQMPIPSLLAERNLDSMNYMLINIGSKNPPHEAMKGFPVCGNCHSFTADGSTIALDLDAGRRDKGGYFISEIEDTILFNIKNYLSWSEIEKRRTFGLFSKISPDGRYVVTTVKDRVVFYNYPANSVENVVYSQLFFPVNGNLAIYDRQTKTLKELPGANLEEFVQSNAIWDPDGKSIIFSRADALPRENIDEYIVQDADLINEFVERKQTFKFDLYRIPFNDGDGGTAEPIMGASENGKSNYFPAVSPDGKWLVYCQAEHFMLLMPDSRLYIVPLEGGNARELKSNLNSLNSWHAWSPNSKWVVFASKGLSAYTDMFLTHIDEIGDASIPVLVDKARVFERVINYPEFVNRNPEDVFLMDYDYVELTHIQKAFQRGEREKAKELFYRLEAQQTYLFSEDYADLSMILKRLGLTEESKKYAKLAEETVDSKIFDSE